MRGPGGHGFAGQALPTARPVHFDTIRLIALFKFAKAVFLGFSLYGMHRLLDAQTSDRVLSWADSLTDRFARGVVLRTISDIAMLDSATRAATVGLAFTYGLLVLVEGVGLWMHRRWAHWLTVASTAAFVPFELWRLISHRHENPGPMVALLLINVVILAYLARRLATGGRPKSAPWPSRGGGRRVIAGRRITPI